MKQKSNFWRKHEFYSTYCKNTKKLKWHFYFIFHVQSKFSIRFSKFLFWNFTILCGVYEKYHDLWPSCTTLYPRLMQRINSFSDSLISAGYFWYMEQSIFKKKYLQTGGLVEVLKSFFSRLMLTIDDGSIMFDKAINFIFCSLSFLCFVWLLGCSFFLSIVSFFLPFFLSFFYFVLSVFLFWTEIAGNHGMKALCFTINWSLKSALTSYLTNLQCFYFFLSLSLCLAVCLLAFLSLIFRCVLASL